MKKPRLKDGAIPRLFLNNNALIPKFNFEIDSVDTEPTTSFDKDVIEVNQVWKFKIVIIYVHNLITEVSKALTQYKFCLSILRMKLLNLPFNVTSRLCAYSILHNTILSNIISNYNSKCNLCLDI